MDTDTTTRATCTCTADDWNPECEGADHTERLTTPTPDPAAKLKVDYPAVTQFKGRTIRYAPLTSGQAIALQSLSRDEEDHLTRESFEIILAVLEGCIGPAQWMRVSLDLGRKKIDEADVVRLFVKIMDKAKRDADKAKQA